MTVFRYREASAADLPRIVEIYNSTVPSRQVTADTEPVTVASREPWFAAHGPERRPLWVFSAESAPDEIAGWLSYSDFYGRPAYAGTAEVSIYVHEGWRGKGLGRHALQQAIDHAPAIGVHTLLGFIFGHNQPSLALFQRFGFATWGHLPRVATLDGVERDLLILGKRLD
jgi:L-amino acid N-acyltransferase YncA